MLSDYEKDQKYQKIAMDFLKKDIRAMIDEALTPQIRKFLPLLIKKLDDLNSFEKKLKELYS